MKARASTAPVTIRQHLEAEEHRLLAALKPLREALEPMEEELVDVQRALRAVGAMPVGGEVARGGPHRRTVRRKTETGLQTLTDTLRDILKENRAGLTSVEIHKICEARLGRKVRDENVRGQLSRLKKNGVAAWFDGLWFDFDASPPVSLGKAHS